MHPLILSVGMTLSFSLSFSLLGRGLSADELRFEKIRLTHEFFSEGAHYADFNRDSHIDVVAGPYWYAGPEFKTKHAYMEVQAKDPHGYAPNFLTFTHDLNGDGWQDIIVIGFPGEETYWYANPGERNRKDGAVAGSATDWERHLAFDVTDNESPGFGDLTGDGRPELIFQTDGRLGYAAPDWDAPTQPWKFVPISSNRGWQKYTHGLGYGDVNNDGRIDLILREGWWEQPAKRDGVQPWTYHEANFGEGGAQMFAYDVDGDGDNDVITSLEAHRYGLAWFESKPAADGNGLVFTRHTIVGSKPEDNRQGVCFSQPHAVDLADINGDGLLDIVTGKRFWAHGPKGDVEPNAPAVLYWFELKRGDEGAEYIAHKIDDDSGVGTQVIAADVSGDGRPDIIVGNKKGAFVFRQQP